MNIIQSNNMKNFTRTTIQAALATLALASCAKDIDVVSEQKESELMTITVEASLPDYCEGTKGSLVNTVRIAWQNGDKVSVYDNTGCLGTLDAVLNGSSDKYAILSGTINRSTAEKLTLVATSEGIEPIVNTPFEDIKFNISAQDSASAPYVAYAMLANPNASTVNKLSTSFSLATSVIKVNCTGLKEGVPAISATIDSVFTELVITPKANEAPSISSAKKGSITRTISGDNLGTANAEGIMTFTVAVLEQDTAIDRVIKVSQEKWPTSATFSAAALTKGYSYNTVCQLCGPYKTVGGHSGVRLWDGGPYWATTNLGAESQTAYGWYYMWADTQGYEYNSGFKKPGSGEPIAEGGFVAKNAPYYTEPNYYKYDGSSSQLEPIDDAATLEWGSGWRIPTNLEFNGLIDNCEATWSSRLGGYLFTGKEEYAGVSVFFPATGYCTGTSAPQSVGNMGSYWSSTLVTGNKERAYRFYFNKGEAPGKDSNHNRCLGFSIRPVMD